MKRMSQAILVCIALSTSASCAAPLNWTEIAAAEFRGDWPLTVDSGEVACASDRAVLFRTADTVYGVNALALLRGFPDLSPIWMMHSDHRGMDMRPLLREGLLHC